MPTFDDEIRSHRSSERYQCPPFFSARICSGKRVENNAKIENLGMKGLSAKTSCQFEKGMLAEVELKTKYVKPIKVQARVRWILPAEGEANSHVIGFSIHKIPLLHWFRFRKLLSLIKKEVW